MDLATILIIVLLGIIAWNLKTGFESIENHLKELKQEVKKLIK